MYKSMRKVRLPEKVFSLKNPSNCDRHCCRYCRNSGYGHRSGSDALASARLCRPRLALLLAVMAIVAFSLDSSGGRTLLYWLGRLGTELILSLCALMLFGTERKLTKEWHST